MLRTSLAILAMMLFVGAAYAANDATSESDAIQLDQGTQPSSPGAMEHQPNTSPDAAEQGQMNEDTGEINN
jgi:hypothetical protein